MFGPWGTGIGAALGAMLGIIPGLTEGGLPKMTKPQGFANALEGSGNPLEAMLGQYIQQFGIGKGIPLSSSSPTPGFQPTAMGNVLEFLAGQQFPDLHGTTLTPKGQTGYQHPVGLAMRPLSYLQGLVPNSTELNFAQLKQIMPEIEQILLHRGRDGIGKGLTGLLQGENTLATKLQAAETF
jgi:hypothetical protein